MKIILNNDQVREAPLVHITHGENLRQHSLTLGKARVEQKMLKQAHKVSIIPYEFHCCG